MHQPRAIWTIPIYFNPGLNFKAAVNYSASGPHGAIATSFTHHHPCGCGVCSKLTRSAQFKACWDEQNKEKKAKGPMANK